MDLSVFKVEVGGGLPTLDEVDFPPQTGAGLYDVAQKWRDLKALLVAWLDWSAVILSRVALDCIWLMDCWMFK